MEGAWKCKLPDPQGRGSLSSPSCRPPLARRKDSLGPWENTHRMSLSVPTWMLMQEKAKEVLDLLWPLLHNGAQPALWKHPGVLATVIGAAMVIMIALAAALGVERSKQPPPCPPTSGCPENWIRIQGKFYYFSKAEGNWTDSQNNCSLHAASLAAIENLQELASLLPYPGRLDHWIGLRKDAGGVWRWVNGTQFDHRFEIQGGADCAYLDRDLNVSSSSCSRLRRWLCSKPNTPL